MTLALEEMQSDAVPEIKNDAFNNGNPIPAPDGGMFQAGKLWTYAWESSPSFGFVGVSINRFMRRRTPRTSTSYLLLIILSCQMVPQLFGLNNKISLFTTTWKILRWSLRPLGLRKTQRQGLWWIPKHRFGQWQAICQWSTIFFLVLKPI